MGDSDHRRLPQRKSVADGRVSAPKNVGTRPLLDPPSDRGIRRPKDSKTTNEQLLAKPVPPVPKLSSPTNIGVSQVPRQKVTPQGAEDGQHQQTPLSSTQLGLLFVAAATVGGVIAWFITL